MPQMVPEECLPQLFCNVWSEWSDEDDEILQQFLVVALLLTEFMVKTIYAIIMLSVFLAVALLLTEFVHGNHEG